MLTFTEICNARDFWHKCKSTINLHITNEKQGINRDEICVLCELSLNVGVLLADLFFNALCRHLKCYPRF